MKVMKTPTAPYDVEEWIQGVEEDDPKGKARKGDVVDQRPGQRNTHSQYTCWDRRWCQGQGEPQFPRNTSCGSTSSGGGSSNWGSDQSSQHSTITRASGDGNLPAWPGRGLRVKVNLLAFKDKKTKDVVTPFVTVGCSHLPLLRMGLPALAAICNPVLAGITWRPCLESRWGCYPDWCPPDTGWTLWHGDDIWHPEWGALFPQTRIRGKCGRIWSTLVAAGSDTPVPVSRKDQWEHEEEMKQEHFYKGLNP